MNGRKARRAQCADTGEKFDSVADAARRMGLTAGVLYKAIRGGGPGDARVYPALRGAPYPAAAAGDTFAPTDHCY